MPFTKLSNQFKINYLLWATALLLTSTALFAQADNAAYFITSNSWKKAEWRVMPAMQYRAGGPVESDLLKNEKECKKDDYYVFNADGTYQLLNGEKKCSAAEEDLVSSGKWGLLQTDHSILNIVPGGKGGVLQRKIIELSAEKFVITSTQIKNGIKYSFTETFVAIQ
jgi:hypothetical protein